VEDVAAAPDTPLRRRDHDSHPFAAKSQPRGRRGEVGRVQEHFDQVTAQARARGRRGALEREQELFWRQKQEQQHRARVVAREVGHEQEEPDVVLLLVELEQQPNKSRRRHFVMREVGKDQAAGQPRFVVVRWALGRAQETSATVLCFSLVLGSITA
jgi:hypothetical protein